jgi:hypothetical protein
MRRAAMVALLAVPALAQAPLKLTIPKDRPRIGFASADLDRIRTNIEKEPWSGLWKTVVARSEGVRRGSLDPKNAFGGRPGQSQRFSTTESLECLAFHALIGKDEAAAKALSEFFEAWDPAPLEADIAENDFMSSGEFFEGLAVVLDWTWDLLTPAALGKLRGIVERRAKHNHEGFAQKKSWEATTEANNHSMAAMGALGIAAVALWHENAESPAWAGLAQAKMKAYLATSFDADGACYEGTMYGPFGIFRILPFADACARYGGGDAFAGGFLDRVVAQLVAEIVPGRERMLPINDTDGNFRPWGGTIFLYAAVRQKNALARWCWTELLGRQAGNGGHTWAFACAWEDGEGSGAAPAAKVACAKGRGILTVRTGWEKGDFLAAFECGKRVAGCHGQSDVGNFLIYAKGECLAADTGYSNVAQEGTPHQTVGHNLVLCDGKGQVLTGGGAVTEGKLVQWEEKKTCVWAQADLRDAYGQKSYNPLAAATRVFLCLTGDDPYVVIVDGFAKDAKEHEWAWLLHGYGTFETAEASATHATGGAVLDITPCPADAGKLAFGTTTFPSGNFGEHPRLDVKFRGKRWLAATVLTPRGKGDEPTKVVSVVKSGKLVVTVTRGEKKDELAVTGAPNGGVGAVKMVRSEGGKVVEQADLKMK